MQPERHQHRGRGGGVLVGKPILLRLGGGGGRGPIAYADRNESLATLSCVNSTRNPTPSSETLDPKSKRPKWQSKPQKSSTPLSFLPG